MALLLGVPPVAAQAASKAKPSAALQKEFDGFIAKFRAALKTNDAAAVTAMTRLPYFNGQTHIGADEFRAKAYPATFPAKIRACLQRERGVHDRDGLGKDNYFIFCGEQIFVFAREPAGFLFAEVGAND